MGGHGAIRFLWSEASLYVRVRLMLVVIVVATGSVLTALGPPILMVMVNQLARQRGRLSISEFLLPGMYVLFYVLARIANEARAWMFAKAEQRLFRSLSERAFAHAIALPLRFFLERKTGAVTQIVDNGIDGIRLILRRMVFTYVPVVVELGTVILVLVHIAEAPLVLLFVGALVCYGAVFLYSGSSIFEPAREASAARVAAASMVTEGLLNYEVVKCFTAEGLVGRRVVRALERCESKWMGFYRRYAVGGFMSAGVFVAFLAGTVLCSIVQVREGIITLGAFVMINVYVLEVVRPIEMIGSGVQGVSQGMAMLQDLLRLLREPTETEAISCASEIAKDGSLEFVDVSVAYAVGRAALAGIGFKVAAGCTLGIVGESGSGKSTVGRAVMRLVEPDRGSILLDGNLISRMSLRDVRQAIAVVPQESVLFDDTIRFNIGVGRPGASDAEIERAARIARVHEFAVGLPDGYETMVGERGVRISGGERQRIAIARAVLRAPRIYVLDEATSSLDSRTEEVILDNLRTAARSRTMIVIAHRLSTILHADEILVLENGAVAERGTHTSLLRGNGKYAALWRSQQWTSARS